MIDTKQIRESVATICQKFGEQYWRDLDKGKEYPTDFVKEMTTSGFLNILIPQEYGGAGLGLKEACVVLEEISLQGAHAGACHAQMYVMGTLLRHGSDKQKKEYLPKISSGELRLQSFAVTEPNSGTDTTSIKTMAKKTNDGWIINGQKVWISRVEHSDLMILLARTKPQGALPKKTDGFSVFLINIEQAKESGLKIVKIDSMINHHSCELFFDDVFIPDESIIGEEDKGFRAIMDGMNAERILIASECIGDGKYFIEKSVKYAKTRKIFNREIGMNQGIQFPIAECYSQIGAASLMVDKAATLFDEGKKCGAEANMAKMLAADASWKAGTTAMETFGGFGFSKEYDIERKFRETRLYQTAPVSRNLILSYIAEHVLNLPRSF
ncbi:acyl-CoA/acyl-ACP dehydrogenase [Paracoccaceae bacterium]|nr:acyl-CoA/acyl-ACP dehydrogenase [Paracoccaceae bacterium]